MTQSPLTETSLKAINVELESDIFLRTFGYSPGQGTEFMIEIPIKQYSFI